MNECTECIAGRRYFRGMSKYQGLQCQVCLESRRNYKEVHMGILGAQRSGLDPTMVA